MPADAGRSPLHGLRVGEREVRRDQPEQLPACRWTFPHPSAGDEAGLVAVGADLEPPTLIAAYSRGLFPMPLRPGGRIGWWSPPERGVLEPERLIVRRSLRQACRRYEIRVDTAFAEVVEGCADPSRPHGWIDEQMRTAYVRMHREGFAHSVEAWSGGELAGGLYGVALGGLFAGESMFYRSRDASKAALVALAAGLRDGQPRLIDVQWATPHLRSLGVSAIPRPDYLQRLGELLASPPPALFG
ncbi:MAG: leucyl/phenylalanyl-tRNA--protein transferase [Acidimicrobiaceae bacterium]|nr:leucyl/phenylalanyl-tRNA--protein transferase [Acidimicrobiaceae bacterium]